MATGKALARVATELVLPSGRFASFRRLRVVDMMGMPQDLSSLAFTLCLIARAVQIDGESVSVEELMAMDLQDFFPIQREFIRLFFDGPGVPAA